MAFVHGPGNNGGRWGVGVVSALPCGAGLASLARQTRRPMPLRLEIALRFLLAKRRAMLMSLAGIVFGVAFFVVTQAQTSGFEQFFVRTILGINGALRVQDQFQWPQTSVVAHGVDGAPAAGFRIPLSEGQAWIPGVPQPVPLMAAVREFESVTGVAGVLRGGAAITSGFKTEEGRVLGVEIEDYVAVSDLAQQIRFGDIIAFRDDPSGILLGYRLAERLNVRVGDYVLVQAVAEKRRLQVRGIFETGVDQYDKYHFFVHLTEARQILDKQEGVTYLQVSLHDPSQAPEIARHMEQATDHMTASWQQREKSWLEVFRVLRFSSAISMSAIIFVAGLGMFNVLAIVVMERRREIAILRSMGYSRGDVVTIFMLQGVLVLIAGTALGWALGFAATWGITQVPIRIRGIFSTDHFVVAWSLWHYLSAALVAGIVVFLASWIPARRAAKVEPVEIFRGSGG